MYQLPHYSENDNAIVLDFIKNHSFALLIGVNDQHESVATQIPLLFKEKDGSLILQGHFMKGTDHHKAFEQHAQALVIFTGPHTYISAKWYTNQQQASTWNYMTVHARGELHFLDEASLLTMLDELTSFYENDPDSPASFSRMPNEYVSRLSKAIVAFEIKVESLENVFKLSQNKDELSYENIMRKLAEGDADAKKIGIEMRKRKAKLFSK